MKFEFRVGQWFDFNKLTAWQKQWCSDNLELIGNSFEQVEQGHYNLVRYGYFHHTNSTGFGTTDRFRLNGRNEITFNDFYWGEGEEVLQELILDNPRWVTVKGKDGDTTSFFGYQLVCGKDYKVVNQSEGGYDIQLTPTKVIEVSKEYFHKVTPQYLLPENVIQDEESFDNLVYSVPDISEYEHWMIKLKDLSKDQLLFITSHFKTDIRFKPDLNGQDVVMGCKRGADSKFVWTNDTTNFMPSLSCHYFSFNDLFQEVK
ncbi:hypothetical protein VP14_126 [Vibrio phage VPMCC14]|nr:hypothetical protein VP14_126 [Vibrio phage VPMCC14]